MIEHIHHLYDPLSKVWLNLPHRIYWPQGHEAAFADEADQEHFFGLVMWMGHLKSMQDSIPVLIQAQSHVILAEVEGQFRQALAALPAPPTYDEPLQQLQGQLQAMAAQIEALKTVAAEEEEEPESDQQSSLQIVHIEDYFADQESGLSEGPEVPPKTTRKLPPLEDSDVSTPRPAKRSTTAATKKPSANGRGGAKQKARRILRKAPGIGPTELSKKAGISLSYAKTILAEIRDAKEAQPAAQ